MLSQRVKRRKVNEEEGSYNNNNIESRSMTLLPIKMRSLNPFKKDQNNSPTTVIATARTSMTKQTKLSRSQFRAPSQRVI